MDTFKGIEEGQFVTHLKSKLRDPDMQAVPSALLRARRRALGIARQRGTAVVIVRDWKLVEEKPDDRQADE